MKFFKNSPLKSAFLVLLFAFCVLAIKQFIPQNEKNDPVTRIKEAEKKIEELQKEILIKLDEISKLNGEKEYTQFFLRNGRDKSGFSYYILINNVLTYWSDNEPAIVDTVLANINNGDFLHLSNGDFLAYIKTVNNRKIAGLILIKHKYEYENKYLQNHFNPVLCIGEDFRISNAGETLHLPGNKAAYSLKHDESIKISPPGIIVSLYFIVAIIFLIATYFFLLYFSKSFLFRF